MKVLEMKDLRGDNKDIFEFFEQLKLEDIKKLIIEPDQVSPFLYTEFSFITKNGMKIVFYYHENKKVKHVFIEEEKEEDNYISVFNGEIIEDWLNYIWNQFADYFNLRIRLMFINETIPWKWETEFTY